MLTNRDRLEAQRFERSRLLAVFMASPELVSRSAWRPVLLGLVVAIVLVAASGATGLAGEFAGLDPPEGGVLPIASEQFIVGARFNDLASVQHPDPMRVADG